MVHAPRYEDWEVMLSIGNTLAFEACIRTFLNRGDSIVMEDYAYTSAIYSCRCISRKIWLMSKPTGNKHCRSPNGWRRYETWSPRREAIFLETVARPKAQGCVHRTVRLDLIPDPNFQDGSKSKRIEYVSRAAKAAICNLPETWYSHYWRWSIL